MNKAYRRVFIIAEAGVNHNGSLKTAMRLVDAAARAGADAVKFQTFRADTLASRSSPKFEMLKRLELDAAAHKRLRGYCRRKGIIFLSSPFDIKSADLLGRLGLRIFKIPSGEITNLPYLKKIGALKKKVILSTGMSDLNEVRRALKVLIEAGTHRDAVTVLHCTTAYPAPAEEANLLSMVTMRKRLGVKTGYSDHTLGTEAAIAAVALGAVVVEKHLTLDKRMKGPDHGISLEPDEFKGMVRAIRNTEAALGNGVKSASRSESKNMNMMRKSIVASRAIHKDEVFSEDNMTAKRPGRRGISPMEWHRVIGRRAKKDFRKDDLITL